MPNVGHNELTSFGNVIEYNSKKLYLIRKTIPKFQVYWLTFLIFSMLKSRQGCRLPFQQEYISSSFSLILDSQRPSQIEAIQATKLVFLTQNELLRTSTPLLIHQIMINNQIVDGFSISSNLKTGKNFLTFDEIIKIRPFFINFKEKSDQKFKVKHLAYYIQLYLLQRLFFRYNINMTNFAQNNKIVENYILDKIRYINASEDQVWMARHKVIKKSYMLKKFKIGKIVAKENEKGRVENDLNAACMQKVLRQVDLLKTVQMEGIPKCQKMIKTASSIFLVYDEFAGVSLAEFAKAHLKSYQLSLQTMLRLANKLYAFHQQEVVFLQLSPQNIFVQNNNQLMFGQWSMSIFKNNPKDVFPVLNATKSQFIANQVTQESKFSSASDIFSLGKVFVHIICSNKSSGKDIYFPKQIHELTGKMIDKKMENRPALQKVIQVLEKATENLRVNQSSPREKIEKQLAQTEQSENQQGRSNVPSNLTIYSQERTLRKNLDATRSARNICFDHVLTGMRRAGSQAKVLSPIRKSANTLALKISKNRNLAFFIHNLSQFAIKHSKGEYLSFLLLKQSHQILNDCYLELKNQDLKDAKSDTLLYLLKKETIQMNLCLNMMKEYFICGNPEPSFKAELRNDMDISEKYYREQIMSFSTEFMQQINTTIRENKVSSLNNLVNDLFSAYMILKRVEQGSFEKYWDKIYSTEYAFLESQRYFIEEKKLGYRYLKSKISQILNRK